MKVFVGTGVGRELRAIDESDDLTEKIKGIVSEMLGNIAPFNQEDRFVADDVEDPPPLSNIYVTINKTTEELVEIWNTINNIMLNMTGKWFILTSTGDPMEGTGVDDGIEGVSILMHPDSEESNYHVDGFVFASKKEDEWTSVNFFTDPLTFVGNQLAICEEE